MGLFGFGKSEEQKIKEGIAYYEAMPDSEMEQCLEDLKAFPPNKMPHVYTEYLENRIAKIKEKESRLQNEYMEMLGLRQDSPLEYPTEHKNITHLEHLDALKTTPRDISSEPLREIAGKAPMMGKSKWKENHENGLFFYAYVVQANMNLWEPGDGDNMPAVFVASDDPAYACDIPFLTKMAENVMELKNSNAVPADCKEFISKLRDDQSIFTFPLGNSVTGGVSVWCFTDKISKQSKLPNNCLGTNRIVPYLLLDPFKKQKLTSIKLIDGAFYR